MIKTIPNGTYPTMITPYTADNKVDYNAVEQLLDWYAEKNVDGIFAVCQSSEMFFLSFEERRELLRFIMKHVKKGISVVASGHTADDIQTQIDEAKAFVEEGPDAYVFISNRFADADEGDDVFLKNVERVVSEIKDTSFGIYECPHPYKRLIAPQTLRQLTEIGNFAFLKDTCCDLDMIKAKLAATEGTSMRIYNANSALLLDSLRAGCAGFSGVMGNIHPELYKWLCDNYEKEPDKAELVQAFIGFASATENLQYPVCAKYYLQLEGLDIGIGSRARNADEFVPCVSHQIEQLRTLTQLFKQQIKL